MWGLDEFPVDPWLVRPGLVRVDRMPLGPDSISGYENDDPRVFFMEEVTFSLTEWLEGKSGLAWTRAEDNYES